MVTVPEATKIIIERSRYLVEAVSKGLINYSSLARYIKPEVEKMLMKDVSTASILMAIKRFEETLKTPRYENVFRFPPDMMIRSNLIQITVLNSKGLIEKHAQLLSLLDPEQATTLTITQGVYSTTIIASNELKEKIENILSSEKILTELSFLSGITIRLPEKAIKTPGVYYFFLKSLTWEEINIIEIISSYLELTIVLDERDVNKALSIIQSLFSRNI